MIQYVMNLSLYLLQLLPPGSYFDFTEWIVIWVCVRNVIQTDTLPQLALGHGIL